MGVFWAIANHRGNEYAQQAGIEGGAQGFPFSFFLKNHVNLFEAQFLFTPWLPTEVDQEVFIPGFLFERFLYLS